MIPGDKAVIFPCSSFNASGSSGQPLFCLYYVSTHSSGAVTSITNSCLPLHQPKGEIRANIRQDSESPPALFGGFSNILVWRRSNKSPGSHGLRLTAAKILPPWLNST